ncbi:MAG: hypothetical protein LBJ71_00890 [Holosporaceae bacterium]|jgi:hypothetical protein|nr:hypothetical protein [Holosporaceae bacterium]
MKTSIFKSKVGLLPALAVLFLTSDNFASAFKPRKRVVQFDPSISTFPSSEIQISNYSDNPTMLRLQTEYRALADLSMPGTELYEVKRNAMGVIMPGDPWFCSDVPGRAEAEIPFETIKSESIRMWQEYDLCNCSPALTYVAQCFQDIANYPDLDELTRNYYGVLTQVAFYFASAFDRLPKSLLSADKVAKGLDGCFKNNPEADRVRGIFYAVDQRLHDELNAVTRALANLPQLGTELYKREREAMQIVTPGDPWFFSDNPGADEVAISLEIIKNESVRIWKEYGIYNCSPTLTYAAQCFRNIADCSGLDELTRNHYNALASVATTFADAFDMLQKQSLLPDKISEILNKWFENNPEMNRVKDIFYAVDQKLQDELNAATDWDDFLA